MIKKTFRIWALSVAVILLSALLPSAKCYAEELDTIPSFDLTTPGDGYSAVLYDNSSGLPTSEANVITETDDGFIWIGSYSGLIRYDGNTFLRISSLSGIASVVSLYADSEQRLWIGTNDSGVALMAKGDLTFFGKKDGLASASVKAFAEDNNGNIYAASTGGLCVFDKDLNVSRVEYPELADERVTKLVSDKDGNIYGVTQMGDYFIIGNDKSLLYYATDKGYISSVCSIYPDPDRKDHFYLGSRQSEIIYCSVEDGHMTQNVYSTYPLEHINCIKEYGKQIWFCADNGIGMLDSGRLNVIRDLPLNNSIEEMIKDYQGNLWFVSSKLGVMKIVTNQFVNITEKYGLPQYVVYGTCVYDDKLFIGCKNEGLKVIKNSGEVSKIPLYRVRTASGKGIKSDNLIDLVGTNSIRSIIKDTKGYIWISTYSENSLIRYNKDGSALVFSEEDGLPTNKVRTVYECRNGDILATCTGGVVRISGDEIVEIYDDKYGVASAEILTSCEAEDGNILIGTDGDGLYVLKENKTVRLGLDEGLRSEVIMHIKKDKSLERYWIVTSNSISYMDKDLKVTTVDQFPYSNNFDLFEDENGRMWVLSSNGIYVIPVDQLVKNENLEPVFYDAKNGLPCIASANSYSELTADGDLYIAGTTGVAKVNINKPNEDVDNIKVSVPYVEADGERIYPGENGVFILPADTKKLTFEAYVFTYSLINPQISYYLEGFDNTPQLVKRSEFGAVDYTNLPGGDYRFVMSLLDSRGNSSKNYEFSISKLKKPHEYLIVRIGIMAIISALAGLLVWRIMHVTIISRQVEQIRQAKEEAERANSAKSRFLANMSHEIRTPINTIMGMDEMILREDTENVPDEYSSLVTEYATKIKMASESLLSLVNDLLDLSKVESGKMELIMQEYDTLEVLQSLVMMIRVRSNEKDLSFDVKIDEKLPKKLYGDAGKLREILLNLMTNAVKYTKKGGFTLFATVKEMTEDKCSIYFAVKDTGIGIKKEDMSILFSAFQRLEEDKNSGIQGTGLGLDISKQYVALMGGDLQCDSVYGEGSTFYFTVDQKIVDPEPIGVFKEEKKAGKSKYRAKFVAPSARIVVVDDNEMNLQVIKGLLKPTKVSLTLCKSGQECLDALENGDYHMVLLDHMMPVMDGPKTLENLRPDHPDIPVIALTANIMNGGEDYYKSLGFDDYLSKPVDAEKLEEMIYKYLPEEVLADQGNAIENSESSGADTETAEEERLPDDIAFVADIPEISVEDGLTYCGSGEAYEKFLKTFYRTIDEKSEEIEKALGDEDYELYTIKVHALKSTARIMGASDLSSKAEALENAGKNLDTQFIKGNTPQLLTIFRSFKDKLSKLSEVIAREDAKEEESKAGVSPEELGNAYEALKEFIPQMDYDAVEMVLDELSQYRLPKEDAVFFKKLGELLKKLDWDAITELMEKR